MVSVSGRSAAQGQKLIEGIQVHGNRRIPQETIKSRIFVNAGDIYDEQALERSFNSLWNTGYFDDLRFEREETPKGGYIIHIYVTEKPTIRTINYKGLSSVSQTDVLDAYKKAKVGLSQESQFDMTKVKRAEVILKELLAEHGHQYATVRTEIHKIPPAAVSIDFVIKEGPKVKVGKIRFEGNKKLKTRELRAAMKNLRPVGIPHSIFLENLFPRTYDGSKLQEDAERVRIAYQQRGYFKAIVKDPKTQIVDSGGLHLLPFKHGGGKRVDITVPIEEGDRYRLGSITFKGNKFVTNTKALRSMFKMKDGDIFDTSEVRKGLDNLRKAYGQAGYIDFSALPNTNEDADKKLVNLEIDIDEGKSYSVRRIEFVGNTTTRDKVIRRELVLEEGSIYNSQLWELSLLRLNQLGYFDVLKEEDSTEVKKNSNDGTVDLTLKVKEKGKNSIGLSGGVSGLAGSFIGINYTTNNFLGLGETLTVNGNIGALERSATFGFTEPYLFDRPLTAGFSVFYSRYDYNEAKNLELAANQKLIFNQNSSLFLQNFSQSQAGFSVSASYPIKRSFKRVGLVYQFQNTSVQTFSQASQQYFEAINFDGVSGPNSLRGIITSSISPSFTYNSVNRSYNPNGGKEIYAGVQVSGLGGNVDMIKPTVSYKQFFAVNKRRNIVGYRVLGSFVTGYGGRSAPPYERFYAGGENDIRGFDIRSITPYAYVTNVVQFPLTNPDGTVVPKDPTNPRAGQVTIPIPVQSVIFSGGDSQIIGNVEYRIPIAGPVVFALFNDLGMNFAARESQLQISPTNLAKLNNTLFGCPTLNPVTLTCSGGINLNFSKQLPIVPGTNYVVRMSTGAELQVMLPIVHAPFRIYYAYNPLTLSKHVPAVSTIQRSMFPLGGAGDFSFQQATQTYGSGYFLHEPKSTFRFTVATTF